MKIPCVALAIAVFSMVAAADNSKLLQNNESAVCADFGGIVHLTDDSVCCSTVCGTCGGTDCVNAPGGATNCCQSSIKPAAKLCGVDGRNAPCVLSVERVLCEHTTGTIACPLNYHIEVTDAKFGIYAAGQCGQGSTVPAGCKSSVTDTMREHCDGIQICSVRPASSFFGPDPVLIEQCSGQAKQLVVDYKCEPDGIDEPLAIDTELNKARHREVAVESGFSQAQAQVVFAYEGLPLDTSSGGGFEKLLDIVDSSEPDFGMIALIRILFLSDMHDNYSYDDVILPKLATFQYWPQEGVPAPYEYWSENHLIMWLSTQYLLRQREGWPTDDALLDAKVQHWLDLKLQYGFYEWNSPIYWGYTLSAVMNLADFAEDENIRADAEAVASRLLEEVLRITNDEGVWFPVSGRGKYNKYREPLNDRISQCIWLLTELSDEPARVSQPSAAMATSAMSFQHLTSAWTPTGYAVVQFGHNIDANIHSMFPRQDRTFFQWSAGGYFHPAVATDTAFTLNYLNLTASQLPVLPIGIYDVGSSIGTTWSRSSVLSKAKFHYFKHGGVTLSSVENFYPGYFGWQQFPVMAAVGDKAIFTQSGTVHADWNSRGQLTINTHLPWVIQKQNVALVMYWPNAGIRVGWDTEITLHWKDAWFDETAAHDRWVIGRRGESYIAVYRYRMSEENGWYAVSTNRGRQFWVIVVGNAEMHGSFDGFVRTIKGSTTEEKYRAALPNYFEAKVTVGKTTINHKWEN